MERFALHPRLAADTAFVGDWGLSRVLLMDDRRYPWLVLVPRRAGLVELHDLTHAEAMVLMEEVRRAGRGLARLPGTVKINTGALGNLVPQLHVHVVARRPGDFAWPGPVWGQGVPERYDPAVRESFAADLVTSL